MNQDLNLLCLSAVTIALVHTLCGPDHYIPFVAMSRAGGWSLRKTMIVTLFSGLGHVGSSIILGCVGIALGEILARLEIFEQSRGKVAGWLLIVFGFVYLVWGIVHSYCKRPHMHVHGGGGHSRGQTHSDHVLHKGEAVAAANVDGDPTQPNRLTPWVLFTIFLFGPCEPLIPLLMYPAAQSSWWGVALVSLLFSAVTIATMLCLVYCLVQGARVVRFPGLHQYGHALAGMVVMFCGIAINYGL